MPQLEPLFRKAFPSPAQRCTYKGRFKQKKNFFFWLYFGSYNFRQMRVEVIYEKDYFSYSYLHFKRE